MQIFCSNCGTAILVPPSVKSAVFCPRCGVAVNTGTILPRPPVVVPPPLPVNPMDELAGAVKSGPLAKSSRHAVAVKRKTASAIPLLISVGIWTVLCAGSYPIIKYFVFEQKCNDHVNNRMMAIHNDAVRYVNKGFGLWFWQSESHDISIDDIHEIDKVAGDDQKKQLQALLKILERNLREQGRAQHLSLRLILNQQRLRHFGVVAFG